MKLTINTNHQLPTDQVLVYPDTQRPRRVVLHGTANTSALSAINWWRSNAERVGTPYLIDRNGTVFQAFDPERCWAYHLGVGAKRAWWERSSLGIELVNVGPLRAARAVGSSVERYTWWPEDFTAPYAGPREDVAHTTPFGGFEYFEIYTSTQYDALSALLAHIRARFGFDPLKRPTNTHRPLATSDLEDPDARLGPFTLLSHSNFNTLTEGRPTRTGLAESRPLAKLDVGPAFVWSRLA